MDLALGCQRAGEEHHRLDRQPDARALDADPHRHDEIDERRPDIAQDGKGVADELLHSLAPLGWRQCAPLAARQGVAYTSMLHAIRLVCLAPSPPACCALTACEAGP